MSPCRDGGVHTRGVTGVGVRGRVSAWRYALLTTNPPDGPIDVVTRWIVVSRAAALPMTLVAGLVAGLLAARAPGVDWRLLVLAVIGVTLAHVANNLMDDLYDTTAGSHTATCPRAPEAPPPVLSGLLPGRPLIASVLLRSAVDLVIPVLLALPRGWPVVVFAVAGFIPSVADTAPPLRLKKHGLGE